MHTISHRRLIVAVLLSMFILAIFAFMPSTTVHAATATYFNQLRDYTGTYNSNLARVPGIMKFLVRNQRVALHIEGGTGGTEIMGVVTNAESLIIDYLPESPADITMHIRVGAGTVDRLIAQNSGVAVLEAIGSDIRFEGVGLGNQLRAVIISLGARIARVFA